MKNFIALLVLLRSPIAWVFIVMLCIGMALPSGAQEFWGMLTGAIILIMLGWMVCQVIGIPLLYYFLFVGLVVIIAKPIIGIILAVILITIYFALPDKTNTKNQNVKKENKVSHYSSNVKKSSATKKKNPFFDAVTIDEEVSVEQFIKIRDAINSINMDTVTPSNIHLKLLEIEDKVGMMLFRTETTTVETLKEFKRLLNAKDLDNLKTITLRELLEVDDEDAEEYESKYMEKTASNNNIGFAGAVVGGLAASSLHNDLSKLEQDVEDLEDEYKFERGFDPDLDESEHLYEKYKGNKEEYLKAKAEELQQKNIAYDSYLTEEEKDIYGDE